MPDISVVITSFNIERYIAGAIDSALSQQGVTVEVIVVDDASSDRTWEIISSVSDPRLKSAQLKLNSGPSVARNTAIAMATSPWIAVLDGDDRFAPGRLAHCLLQAQLHDATIIVDNLTIHREDDGKEFPMFPPVELAKLPILDLATFISDTVPGAGNYSLGYFKPIFSVDFLRKHGLAYSPDLHVGEDHLLLSEALACGARCIVLPDAGYIYTVRMGSISHRLSLESIRNMQNATKTFSAKYNLNPAETLALQKREREQSNEFGYTMLIDAIKQRNVAMASRAAFLYPGSMYLLYRPLRVRLKRLFNSFV